MFIFFSTPAAISRLKYNLALMFPATAVLVVFFALLLYAPCTLLFAISSSLITESPPHTYKLHWGFYPDNLQWIW